MTIEQKAKAYDEALWKAVELYRPSDSALLEEIFPELIKYNDEKVRGAIIHFISHTPTVPIGRINKETMLTWLEKQGEQNLIMAKSPQLGEQKPTDKVEPKFHKGDWIITNKKHIWYVDETPKTTSYLYRLINQYGKVEVAEFEVVDEKARLWTIQDAKSGDVIACGKCILIFDQLSEFNNEQVLMDICHCTSKGFYWQDTKDRDLWALDGFKPATKEQRDALFAKMHEAGYKWDAEKKELKIIDWSKHIKYEPNSPSIIEENPAWSDEDEETILKMMFTFRTRVFPSSEECISFIDFLKSLKDKFQPRQNWSEEDEKERKRVVGLLEGWMSTFKETYYAEDCKRGIEWLKSIKQRMG